MALDGVLDTMDADFVMVSGAGSTWADDLCILITDGADLSSAAFLQVGGYSNIGAAHSFGWGTGASGNPGTPVVASLSLGGLDVTGKYLWMGNGYSGGGDGIWSGTINLGGSVAHVPAPGALVARRRRA